MGAFPEYEFDKNRLTWALMTKSPTQPLSDDALRDRCTISLEVFRQNLLLSAFAVPTVDGPLRPWMIKRITDRLSSWFSHSDFDRPGRPSDIGEVLLRASWLEVITNGDYHPYEGYRCSQPLVGNSVTLTPPFNAAKLVMAQLERCLTRPSTALDHHIQLIISVSQAGMIKSEGTFVYPTKPEVINGKEATVRTAGNVVKSWEAAIEAAARDQKCQPLNLPKDRWPDWKEITVDFGP